MSFEELVKAQQSTRKRHSDEEHRLQCACVRWFNLQHKDLQGRLFAVPNGGKRDVATASKLKAEGVVAGVADMMLMVVNKFYGALLIELKTLKGKQSNSQKEWERKITSRCEYKYVVCRSIEEFITEVETYLSAQ